MTTKTQPKPTAAPIHDEELLPRDRFIRDHSAGFPALNMDSTLILLASGARIHLLGYEERHVAPQCMEKGERDIYRHRYFTRRVKLITDAIQAVRQIANAADWDNASMVFPSQLRLIWDERAFGSPPTAGGKFVPWLALRRLQRMLAKCHAALAEMTRPAPVEYEEAATTAV